QEASPAGLANFGFRARPAFADIDGDGDLDAFVGNAYGNTLVVLNTGNYRAPVTSTTPDGTFAVGSVITLQLSFSETLFVDAGGGSGPTLALETGAADRLATYSGGSGTSTLTFTYTVQAGDNSADLDVTSINALVLNGATIRDAVGNDADLGVVAPGTYGSLSSNAALVIDTVAPEIGSTTRPVFSAPITASPFGLGPVPLYASPALGDIDGDGDLDAFIGEGDGNTLVYLNTGSASSPAFALLGMNVYGLADAGSVANPALADIDADGDLDLFIGEVNGNTLVYLNTGSASTPAFVLSGTNLYGLGDVGGQASPSFVDIDGDGDLDAFIGNYDGLTLLYRNTGNASNPAFVLDSTDYGLSDVDAVASPVFADVDGDGDVDALIGNRDGYTLFYRNDGSASIPSFVLDGSFTRLNGFAGPGSFNRASTTLADIDADGDLDALVGGAFGNTVIYLNTGGLDGTVYASTANGSYGIGSVITLKVDFSENVFVTGGTPTLALETGAFDRLATYSGGSGGKTLSFSYTVQAGDTSADLDLLSSTAWTMNGASIRDAAGNDAVLTLGTPGTYGSLAANANLVIDGIAPTLAITSSDSTLGTGQTALITFTFSEDPGASFAWDGSSGDIVVTGGTLSAITGSGLTRAATFTPVAGVRAGTASITVASAAYTDAVGNSGGAGSSPSLTYDTLSIDQTGSSAPEKITGGAGDDSLDGAGGNDRLAGREGTDHLDGGEGKDSLFGQGGNDSLQGGDGKDILDGGTGADTMTGGDGSDYYYIDSAGDQVIETGTDPLTAGVDTVYSYLSSYTLTSNVERGTIKTAGTASLTGNELNNVLTGGTGANTLNGQGGNDNLSGGNGNDSLIGGAGQDTLTGGAGNDTMLGGDGNDDYHVDSAGDIVIETNAVNSGTDTLYSYLSSYTLTGNVERGVIKTSAAASLTGNELDNSLYGGIGNDSLNGAAGNDILTGGAGADQLTGGAGRDVMTGGLGADAFLFYTGSGRDIIKDFNRAEGDKISLQSNLNGSGIIDAASALAHVKDMWGSALLDLGDGNVIQFTGMVTADLTVADFMVF
ncbi:MAG: FG-GAP-like repeat-containing protein, partial [Pseudomonadota bacterium]